MDDNCEFGSDKSKKIFELTYKGLSRTCKDSMLYYDHEPNKLHFEALASKQLTSIKSGVSHTLMLLDSGEAYAIGKGLCGQLGCTNDSIMKSQQNEYANSACLSLCKYISSEYDYKDANDTTTCPKNAFIPIVFSPVKCCFDFKISSVACGTIVIRISSHSSACR